MAVYTPRSIYKFARDGDANELSVALSQTNNTINWYRDDNYGDTAFHRAAMNGHLKCVRVLLEKGVDINITNNNGLTSFHYAAGHKHLNIIEVLLESGIDMNIKDNDGDTGSIIINIIHFITQL